MSNRETSNFGVSKFFYEKKFRSHFLSLHFNGNKIVGERLIPINQRQATKITEIMNLTYTETNAAHTYLLRVPTKILKSIKLEFFHAWERISHVRHKNDHGR